jgi:hypothetical protein
MRALASIRAAASGGARRIASSAVVWSWFANGLRLASGLLLLPLLLRELSRPDLGMYFLFQTIAMLLPVLDATFAVNLGRHVGYAIAGATDLQPHGVAAAPPQGEPNWALVTRLLGGARILYRWLAVAVFLTLGTIGTWLVATHIHETDAPRWTWVAWGLVLFAAVVEIYSGWANAFLQGMNQILRSARLLVLANSVRILLGCTLLWWGAGLLSVPLATLCASSLQRFLARRACHRHLGLPVRSTPSDSSGRFLAVIWPNTWRVGLKLLSIYAASMAVAQLWLTFFGLAVYGEFGLSWQVLVAMQGMSSVWVAVKWPLVVQLRSKNDALSLRQVLRPRFLLQNLTFAALTGLLWGVGRPLLALLGSGKELLPVPWLEVMTIFVFLEMQFSFWTHLLTTENRVPSLWATVVTYPAGVLLAWWFAHLGWGMGGLVLGPLVAGMGFNYWYWAAAGARSLGSAWRHFVFSTGRQSPPC